MKKVFKEFVPPIFFKIYRKISGLRKRNLSKKKHAVHSTDGTEQDLDVYWDLEMAEMLETWGVDHVWNEIQMLLVGKKGKILDIACGTGTTIEIVSKYKDLEVYGCDISDFLISKAANKGIDKKYLQVCDATNMNMYADDQFDYSYSIGSLEHFTEEGIPKFISEIHRTTKYISYHMMPTSAKNKNEGWINMYQSYFNNSEQWWIEKFRLKFSQVYSINSGWKDDLSIGKWFVCIK